jgi:hypothetical protein
VKERFGEENRENELKKVTKKSKNGNDEGRRKNAEKSKVKHERFIQCIHAVF